MSLVTKQIREGPHCRYRILTVANRISAEKLNCPVFDFFEEAEQDHPEALERLSALLDRTAEFGPVINEQKFKHLEGTELYEFKAKPLRLICFFDRGHVITCTNGTVKKSQKTDPEVIKTAESWKNAHTSTKNSGKLIHEPEH